MDIKRTAIVALLGLSIMNTNSATASTTFSHPPIEFDYYINAALKVYIDVVPPSINTSEIFLSYMQEKWRQKPCLSEGECTKMGLRVAHEFASVYNKT